jgi:hypothetical protein
MRADPPVTREAALSHWRGIVTEAWCYPENAQKVLDTDLAERIATLIVAALAPIPAAGGTQATPITDWKTEYAKSFAEGDTWYRELGRAKANLDDAREAIRLADKIINEATSQNYRTLKAAWLALPAVVEARAEEGR